MAYGTPGLEGIEGLGKVAMGAWKPGRNPEHTLAGLLLLSMHLISSFLGKISSYLSVQWKMAASSSQVHKV